MMPESIQFSTLDEVAAQSGGGVGDCGGEHSLLSTRHRLTD